MLDQTKKIGAISTFLQSLDQLGHVAGTGKQLYFRGHSKRSFRLIPSVYRNKGWMENEATLLKEVVLRCPSDFAGSISTFQTLVRLQHYGLPTRLLDVTSNPLVALWFACEIHADDEDGEVIVLGFDTEQVKYFDSDTVNVLANLSRRPMDFAVPAVSDIFAFNGEENIKLLHHDVCQDRPHFEPKIRRTDLQKVVCVRPRLENPRIIRQEGAFLLFGCNGVKGRPASVPDGSVVARLTINRDRKRILLDQLSTLGVSKATLFPEIDAVASHIRDVYSILTVNLETLPPKQRQVFEALQGTAGLTRDELANLTAHSPREMSRAVAELSKKGFVQSLGSGRGQRWRLTEPLDVRDESKDALLNRDYPALPKEEA